MVLIPLLDVLQSVPVLGYLSFTVLFLLSLFPGNSLGAELAAIFDERENHRAPRVRFESELEDHLSRNDAEKTLRAVTAWARYAELFDYDARTRTFMRRS